MLKILTWTNSLFVLRRWKFLITCILRTCLSFKNVPFPRRIESFWQLGRFLERVCLSLTTFMLSKRSARRVTYWNQNHFFSRPACFHHRNDFSKRAWSRGFIFRFWTVSGCIRSSVNVLENECGQEASMVLCVSSAQFTRVIVPIIRNHNFAEVYHLIDCIALIVNFCFLCGLFAWI